MDLDPGIPHPLQQLISDNASVDSQCKKVISRGITIEEAAQLRAGLVQEGDSLVVEAACAAATRRHRSGPARGGRWGRRRCGRPVITFGACFVNCTRDVVSV
jgi:hypothetical protein